MNIVKSLPLLFLMACAKSKDTASTQNTAPTVLPTTYACAYKETATIKAYNSWTNKYYTITKNTFDCISSKGEVCVTETIDGKSGFTSSCEESSLIDETTLEVM